MNSHTEDSALIELVRKYSHIYNKKHPLYKNREAVENAWGCVAAEMEVEVEDVKNRWTYLRTRFIKERARLNNLPSGSAQVSEWELYKELLFLTSIIKVRKTFGNMKKKSTVSEGHISFIEIPTVSITNSIEELEESVDDVEALYIDPVTGEVTSEQDTSLDEQQKEEKIPGPAKNIEKLNKNLKRRRVLELEEEFNVNFSEAVSTFKELVQESKNNTTNSKSEDQDSIDLFCKMLSVQMNKVPTTEILDCQMEILSVVKRFIYK